LAPQVRCTAPPGRTEVEDVAAVVTFLASDESAWLTGTAQVIDGGLTLGKPWRRQPATVTEHRPLFPG
jgi:NAD(P)-dependent dehydrogenase (short-subunit alcohol dehydrogenase family)